MTGPFGLPYSAPDSVVMYHCPDCDFRQMGRPEWNWECPHCDDS